MTFAEKLKSMRKQAGMSQEKLSEKLGVSRQAITKWETDAGIPDIENLMAISTLFGVSIDDLLSGEKLADKSTDYLYESVTEYDIDCEEKKYDMHFGGANRLVMSGYDGEKIRVRLVSNTLATIQNDFKLKIDDGKNNIDVDLSRKNGVTEATAKEELTILVQLPNGYLGEVECSANVENLEICNLECDSIELDVKTNNVVLSDVVGTVEINCNLDMNIICETLKGSVEINQVSATSRICLPEGTPFTAVKKGMSTSISYEINGKPTESFSTPDAENVVELNGIKSELVICK